MKPGVRGTWGVGFVLRAGVTRRRLKPTAIVVATYLLASAGRRSVNN
jgi:hypothetical protein